MMHPQAAAYLRKRVVSGLGEDIGVVVDVELAREGVPRRFWVLEDGPDGPGRLREVDARFVRGVIDGHILLKGPREGYHITRIGP